MIPTAQKIIFLGWIALSLGVAYLFFQLTPVSNGPQYREFEISKGNGFQGIVDGLYAQKFIRSPKVFMLYGALSGSAHQLKPGSYLLSSGSSTPEILEVIKRGPSLDVSVILQEGVTMKDMDVILSQKGIISAGSLSKLTAKSLAGKYPFLKNTKGLEGFLFPDTYRFYKQSGADAVAGKILNTFAAKAWPLLSGCDRQSSKCSGLNSAEILTVASLLEKEAPIFYDRQMIAGIIYRRLAIGIALQIDATLVYAKCNGTFITCADSRVYRKDLAFPSPYNTYLHNSLPPGPIGNPGLEAIQAALSPIKSKYLYYLSDPKTGKTIFSETLDEHIENRSKYLGA